MFYGIKNMKDKQYNLGILAFGSLIDDPGKEQKDFIIKKVNNVETPFKVEYGRKSSGRGNAPTLIPISNGGAKVKATLLILSDKLRVDDAKNMLYRRELNKVGSDKTYKERDNPTPNQLVIEVYNDIKNVRNVLTAKFGSNLDKITPEILAELAIKSFKSKDVEKGRDGISYLLNNINNGIITPLTEKYEKAILQKMNAKGLEEIIQKKTPQNKKYSAFGRQC